MKPVRAALLGLATLTGAGCFTARPSGPDWFFHHAARNLTEKPIAHYDERKFTKYVERRAEEAWEQVCRSTGRKHGDPFGEGFREGFVDYVEAGGTGEPPYLPPFRYRLTKYRSADGIRAIESWYDGFRYGAAVARESGLRELNYVPLPGAVLLQGARSHAVAEVASGAPVPAQEPAPGAPEFLPAPRPVGPGDGPQMPEANPPAVKQEAMVPAVTPRALPLSVPAPPPITSASAPSSEPPGAVVPVAAAVPAQPVPNSTPAFVVDRGPSVGAGVPAVWASVTRPKAEFGPWLPVRSLRKPSAGRDP